MKTHNTHTHVLLQ